MANNKPGDNDTTSDNTLSTTPKPASVLRLRNAVILPDGTKKEPLGSGVITGILGVGGMATVYEIWNSQLEVARAVKLLHPNYTEETRQRFQTEIKITAKLHHRNIIEIHAVGHWNGLPYIEMELIKGETLEKILDKRGALPIDVCTSIGIMVGRALHYAHNQDYVIYGTTYHGVIHRDLKPSNIMVTNEGIVKLMDFGIARPADASIHTTDGAILGTMQYLSPEQLDGKEPDIRTDIYSLGTILYELLTGVKAFPEHNISKLMLSKIKNDFKPLEYFDTKIPTKLRRLVHRCMTYDRDKRIPNAQAFLSEISKIHHGVSEYSPEHIVKQFLKEERSDRIVIRTRRSVPKKVLIAGGITALAALTVWVGEHYLKKRSIQKVPQLQLSEEKDERLKSDFVSPPQSLDVGLDEKSEKKLGDNMGVKEIHRQAVKAVNEPKIKDVTSPPVQSRSFIERLQERYGTSDLLTIFTSEVQRRRYQDALKIYDSLPLDVASSLRAVIFRIRALRALGRKSELRSVLDSTVFEDGEIHLERARLSFEDNDIGKALVHLKACERSSSTFMESGILRLERIYLEARCAGKKFDDEQSAESKRYALDRWFEVKSELRTSPDHPYFREAETQMQRIAGK